MNYKRAFTTGVMLWLIVSVVTSVLMVFPFLVDKKLIQFGIFWLLLIPIVLLLCKWHFKMDEPTFKKGFLLGIVLLVIVLFLDIVITIPLFTKSYTTFFGDWMMYIGYGEVFVLSIFAGSEFDKTYTIR